MLLYKILFSLSKPVLRVVRLEKEKTFMVEKLIMKREREKEKEKEEKRGDLFEREKRGKKK